MKDETSSLDRYSGQLDALLEGGPADIPTDRREQLVEAGLEKIKLPYYGGYEHFERTDEQSGHFVVYRWVARTEIAE
ncbi:DUF5988 family protein [Streptacidiphilus carbonis]|uniref:DUF5988 family protein n=1 Tax=Streptacidiphilus carbonis TaxID=105422 RepID=UPI0005A91C78|nr:DUF5988 family protein [Streptacidiphilus carbonis]